ncbi:MAG: hypothetical protein ACYCTI_06670 [Acidimicrobiales bacterium]
MFGLDDLHAVGERNDVPGYRGLMRDVREAAAGGPPVDRARPPAGGALVDSWRAFAEEAELDDHAAKAVAEDIERFRPR